ncbi:MAG TPA: hypothetical protein DCW87_12495 [Comamonadaceae bacterium]|nr:hypothetical protein [Comamonadaceae bacterium]
MAAKEIARAENTSLGKVISRLVRLALTGGAAPPSTSNLPATATGFVPFEPRGVGVSNDLINRLRDADGI